MKKLTIIADESDIMTIGEIIEKLGLEEFCVKECEDPFMFEFDDGWFNVRTGVITYRDVTKDDFDYYETELGCYSLREALDCTTLVWAKDESGKYVAYYEL